MSLTEKMQTITNNTPAVIEAVNAAKTTLSGTIFRVDNALETGQPLDIKTSPGGVVGVLGKNLVDYTKAAGRIASQKVEIVDNGVLWKSGGNYFFQIPMSLPAGVTVRFSCETEPNDAGEYLQLVRLIADDGTQIILWDNTSNDYKVTTTKAIKAMYFYKGSAATALTQDLLISNIQIEIGNTVTDYEAYKGVKAATADANGKVVGLKLVTPTMTIASSSTAELTYFPQESEDIYNKYQNLKATQIALKENVNGKIHL